MGWLLKRLGGAIVAGIGWKLGTDAYEAIKERLKNRKTDTSGTEGESPEGAVAATVVSTPPADGPERS